MPRRHDDLFGDIASFPALVAAARRAARGKRRNRTTARFLGLTLLPSGRRRLPEEAVRRFRNRLRGLRDRWSAGSIELPEVQARVNAWIAHADHADTWRLRHAIFEGGMFDPALDPTGRGRQ